MNGLSEVQLHAVPLFVHVPNVATPPHLAASARLLVQLERSRGISLSPDGKRGILLIAQAQDSAANGLFLLSLEGGSAPPQRLDFFGAYKWCDATRLLYVPLEASAPANELWRLDVTTLKAERLIAAAADGPFKIASGDWDVSSDGRRIVFLSARDRNIWTVTLPAACGLEP